LYKPNNIYNADAEVSIQNIEDESIDLVLTDPPYGISRDSGFKSMNRNGIDFGEWDKEFDQVGWLSLVAPKIKKGGSIIIFNSIENFGLIKRELERHGFQSKEFITWVKTNPMPRNRDRLYVTSRETAIWLTKGKGWTFNRISQTYENGFFHHAIVHHKDRIHPTQKPVKLLEEILLIHSNENDLVLDCFCGSGSTAIACANTGRKFICFEKDKRMYELAKERIEQHHTQMFFPL